MVPHLQTELPGPGGNNGRAQRGRGAYHHLSEHRDIAAAKRFFKQAVEKRGVPEKITLDGYAASHVAVAELQEEGILPAELTVRACKYLNNVIEQDHRYVKQRVIPISTLSASLMPR